MVYGVEENDDKSKLPDVDKETVLKLFKEQLNISGINITKLYRVGKVRSGSSTPVVASERKDRPRPIKVILASMDEKNKVMTSYRKSKENKELGFGISSDFTKSETEKYQALKAELRRKEAYGETGWIIKRSRLIKKK